MNWLNQRLPEFSVINKEKASCTQCPGHTHSQEARLLNIIYIRSCQTKFNCNTVGYFGDNCKPTLQIDGKLNVADKDI